MYPTGITNTSERRTSLDLSQQSSRAYSSYPPTQETDSFAHEGQQTSRRQVTTTRPDSSPLQHPSTTQDAASRETGLNREPPLMENRASTSSENVLHNNELLPNIPREYTQLNVFTPHPDSHYLVSAECPFSGGSIAPEEEGDFSITLPVTFTPKNSTKKRYIKNKHGQDYFRVYEFSDLKKAYNKQQAGNIPNGGWREVVIGDGKIPPPTHWSSCDLQGLKAFYEEQQKTEKMNDEKELKRKSTFNHLLKDPEYIYLQEKIQQLTTYIDHSLENDAFTPECAYIKKEFDNIFNGTWMKEYLKLYSETMDMQEFKKIIFSKNSDLHKPIQTAHDLFKNLKNLADDITSLPTLEDSKLMTIASPAIQQLLHGKTTMKDIKETYSRKVVDLIRKKIKIQKRIPTNGSVFPEVRYLIYYPKSKSNLLDTQTKRYRLLSSYPNLREIHYRVSHLIRSDYFDAFKKLTRLQHLDFSLACIRSYERDQIGMPGYLSGCRISYAYYPEAPEAMNWSIYMLNDDYRFPQSLKRIRIDGLDADIPPPEEIFWDIIRKKLEKDGTLTFENYRKDTLAINPTSIPSDLRSCVTSYQVRSTPYISPHSNEFIIKYIKDILPNLKEITLTKDNLTETWEEYLHNFIREWGQAACDILLKHSIQVRIVNRHKCREMPIDRIYVPNETRTAYKLAEDDEIAFC